MSTLLMTVHIFTCILLVLVVLVQSGKEGGLGMMGGGTGSSQSIFGSSGGADFFTKFTSGAAAVFMLTSIFLSVVKGGKHNSVFAQPSAKTAIPSAPSPLGAKPGSASTTTAPAAPGEKPSAPAAPSKAPETATPNDKK